MAGLSLSFNIFLSIICYYFRASNALVLTNIYEYTIIYTVAAFSKKKEAPKSNLLNQNGMIDMKKVFILMIVAAMLLVAMVSAYKPMPVSTDEKTPLLKASNSDPTQEAIDRGRSTNTVGKGDPTQEAIDRGRGTQRSPIDPFTAVLGLGIGGAAILYRYRRRK